MLSKILIILGLAAAGLLFVVFTTIYPSSGGAPAILVVFLLSYVALVCALTFALRSANIIIARLYKQVAGKTSRTFSLKRSYYYSSVIALAPVIIVSLQSVGEVGAYEVGLIVLFVFLGCVYVAKRSDS